MCSPCRMDSACIQMEFTRESMGHVVEQVLEELGGQARPRARGGRIMARSLLWQRCAGGSLAGSCQIFHGSKHVFSNNCYLANACRGVLISKSCGGFDPADEPSGCTAGRFSAFSGRSRGEIDCKMSRHEATAECSDQNVQPRHVPTPAQTCAHASFPHLQFHAVAPSDSEVLTRDTRNCCLNLFAPSSRAFHAVFEVLPAHSLLFHLPGSAVGHDQLLPDVRKPPSR